MDVNVEIKVEFSFADDEVITASFMTNCSPMMVSNDFCPERMEQIRRSEAFNDASRLIQEAISILLTLENDNAH